MSGRILVALVVLWLPASAPAAGRLLGAVGEVSDTGAALWMRRAEEGPVAVEVAAAGDGDATRRTATVTVSPAADLTAVLRLDGLAPGTRHAWRLTAGAETVAGEFVTAPPPDEPARVRFVWSGDLGSSKNCRRPGAGFPIFRAMAGSRPDFFLFVGDTIYADHSCNMPDAVPGADFVATTLGGFRAKHRHHREDPALAAFLAGTSVYAIWDDHEVRNNFAGPHEPLMPAGRQAFLEYWPIRPPADEPGRLYRRVRWGRLLEVFILDTRQYRSANTEPDGPAKTMLGRAQRRWLLDGLSASPALWKVVVTSVPLSVPTGRNGRDAWSNATVWGVPDENGTGFAVERDGMLRVLRERGVKNLVFLAADVHHPELIRHHPAPEFSFHEFIAGPLSAAQGRPRPLDQGLHPRSLFARGGVFSFGEVTIEPATLVVRLLDQDGGLLFSHATGPE
jgi:alkaline phosphatase D